MYRAGSYDLETHMIAHGICHHCYRASTLQRQQRRHTDKKVDPRNVKNLFRAKHYTFLTLRVRKSNKTHQRRHIQIRQM